MPQPSHLHIAALSRGQQTWHTSILFHPTVLVPCDLAKSSVAASSGYSGLRSSLKERAKLRKSYCAAGGHSTIGTRSHHRLGQNDEKHQDTDSYANNEQFSASHNWPSLCGARGGRRGNTSVTFSAGKLARVCTSGKTTSTRILIQHPRLAQPAGAHRLAPDHFTGGYCFRLLLRQDD